jgi:hypothetical protein
MAADTTSNIQQYKRPTGGEHDGLDGLVFQVKYRLVFGFGFLDIGIVDVLVRRA